jgi:hypothetical protein
VFSHPRATTARVEITVYPAADDGRSGSESPRVSELCIARLAYGAGGGNVSYLAMSAITGLMSAGGQEGSLAIISLGSSK